MYASPASIVQAGLVFWVLLDIGVQDKVVVVRVRVGLILLIVVTFVIFQLLAGSHNCLTFPLAANMDSLAVEQVLYHLNVITRVVEILMVKVNQISLQVQVFVVSRLNLLSLHRHLDSGPALTDRYIWALCLVCFLKLITNCLVSSIFTAVINTHLILPELKENLLIFLVNYIDVLGD